MLETGQTFEFDSSVSFSFSYTLVHGERVPLHQHSQGQVVYPATGIMAVTTESGTWIAPANRAVWTPAGFAHDHRSYGTTDMRAVAIPDVLAEKLPARPTVMAVSSLFREVLMALSTELPENLGRQITSSRLRPTSWSRLPRNHCISPSPSTTGCER